MPVAATKHEHIITRLSATRRRMSAGEDSSPGVLRPHMLVRKLSHQHSLAKIAAGENTPTVGERHEEMVERFQIRRVTHQRSSVLSVTSSRSTVSETSGNSRTPSQVQCIQPLDTVNMGALRESGNDEESVKIKPQIVTADAASTPSETAELASDNTTKTNMSESETHVVFTGKSRHRGTRKCRLETMSPLSVSFAVRQCLLLAAFGIHIVYFPVGIAFFPANDYGLASSVELIVELVFGLDVLLWFNTEYTTKGGHVVSDRRQIARRYLSTWFIPDLLSCAPIELVLSSMSPGGQTTNTIWTHTVFDACLRSARIVHSIRFLRIAWISRLTRFDKKSLSSCLIYSRYAHLLRVAWITVTVAVVLHYMTCCWHALQMRMAPHNTGFLHQYTSVACETLQLLLGQGGTFTTVEQNIFALVSMFLGSIALAVVFGQVAILVSNFNASSTSYHRKMESVFAIMSKLQLPGPLRSRIHQYYEHLWREYESLDGEIVKFSKGLSHSLELEVVLYKYMDLVMHVPFWRDCSPNFQKQVMLHLQVRVYLPDDYIIRRGEVGDEFYMISRGACELVLDPQSIEGTTPALGAGDSDANLEDAFSAHALHHRSGRSMASRGRSSEAVGVIGGATTHRLGRGQALGELALVMNYDRTADARAVSYLEMCVLSRRAFQSILIKYPKDRRRVLRAVVTRSLEATSERQDQGPLWPLIREVTGPDTYSPGGLSASEAGDLLATAMDVDLPDESIKFGVGAALLPRLRALGDPTIREEPGGGPSYATLLRLMGEMHSELQGLRQQLDRVPVTTSTSTVQTSVTVGVQCDLSALPMDELTSSSSSPARTVAQATATCGNVVEEVVDLDTQTPRGGHQPQQTPLTLSNDQWPRATIFATAHCAAGDRETARHGRFSDPPSDHDLERRPRQRVVLAPLISGGFHHT